MKSTRTNLDMSKITNMKSQFKSKQERKENLLVFTDTIFLRKILTAIFTRGGKKNTLRLHSQLLAI